MSPALEAVRAAIPEPARDIRLNLQSVLSGGSLSAAQRAGVAVASAVAARHPQLLLALEEEARATVDPALCPAVLDDARTAAVLMAMNNVYYRFRHMVGKEVYAGKPARLRMNKLAAPAASRTDLELYCLAVSAIHGCEACVRSHEQVVLEGGLTEEHVHDAVRIAAVVHAAAVALSMAEAEAEAAGAQPTSERASA